MMVAEGWVMQRWEMLWSQDSALHIVNQSPDARPVPGTGKKETITKFHILFTEEHRRGVLEILWQCAVLWNGSNVSPRKQGCVAKQRYQPGKAAIHTPVLEAHLWTHEVPGVPRRPAALELLHERKWKWKAFSSVWLFVTSWSIQSMAFSRPETGVGSCSILQGIFPTQGLNPGLSHCRQILYQLSHQESPRILEWVAYPFSSGSSQSRNRTGVSCIAGGFFTSWASREGPMKHL